MCHSSHFTIGQRLPKLCLRREEACFLTHSVYVAIYGASWSLSALFIV